MFRGEAGKSGHQPALQSTVLTPARGREQWAGRSAAGHSRVRGLAGRLAGDGLCSTFWARVGPSCGEGVVR